MFIDRLARDYSEHLDIDIDDVLFQKALLSCCYECMSFSECDDVGVLSITAWTLMNECEQTGSTSNPQVARKDAPQSAYCVALIRQDCISRILPADYVPYHRQLH